MNDKNLEKLELRSEEVQEILTSVPNWMIRWGNLLFLSLILLILSITWIIKYPEIISAEAIITTETPPEKIYARTTGKINKIFVSDNQFVEEKDLLAILENTANYKDVLKLKKIIDTVQIANDSFTFPLDSLKILFLGDIETQFALFENNYIQYKLNLDLDPYLGESKATNYSISELKRRLVNLRSRRDLNKQELQLANKKLDRNRVLFDKGVISAQDFENEQLEFAISERNFKEFESIISQVKEDISNAITKSKGTAINKVKTDLTLLKNVFQSYDLLKKAIKDWETTYAIRSNINGNVSFLNYWNSNQSVNTGDLIFTIIPNGNLKFKAKLKTPTQNSGKILIGQTVNIKLDNYPSSEYGVISGKVNNISTTSTKDSFYYVDVEIPEKMITSYGIQIAFKQEMRGSAEIITEDLRLIERLFYTFNEVLSRK
tara:strand:- start:19954 stop:21252 length:1299 start_codon:yes stop_codon:yes gene_type:complete